MKKILFFIILMFVIITPINAAAEYELIYEYKDTTNFMKNSFHHEIIKYTDKGKIEIDIIEIDLSNKDLDIKPLIDKNISQRKTLADIAGANKAIAAINGDFFSMDKFSFSYGTLITGKDIVSSPNISFYKYPTISRINGKYDISVWEASTKILVNNKYYDIAAINKLGAFNGEMIILNRYWGEKSLGNLYSKDLIEILVVEDRVKEIRMDKEPFIIPENGYIIATSNKNSETIKEMQVNTKIILDINYNYDFNYKNWAVGGVNYLLKDGQIGYIHPGIEGRHPRTAIGFNREWSKAYLFTVDGRTKESIGMTQLELAELMIETGCYYGVNQDGGGSSRMIMDMYGTGKYDTVNNPSDLTERKIVSGIGFFANYAEDKMPKYIQVNPVREKYFINQNIEYEIKAYNKNYVPLKLDENKISISARGLKNIKNNKDIKFKESGIGKIEISYFGKKSSFNVEIIDSPVDITSYIEEIKIAEEEKFVLPEFSGVNKNGESCEIKSEEINWTSKNKLGSVKGNIYYAGMEKGIDVLEGTFGDATIQILVKIGYDSRIINSLNGILEVYLSQYPLNSKSSINTKQKDDRLGLELNYDFTKMIYDDQAISYIDFKYDGITVDEKAKAVSMWVYGDKKNHWLRVRIEDSNNNIYKVDFAKEVNWSGWKKVYAYIPESVVYPIKIKSVYLAEINYNNANTGTIYLDDIALEYELKNIEKNILVKNEIKEEINSVPERYIEKITFTGVNEPGLKGNNEIAAEQPEILNLDISTGKINQWTELKKLEKIDNDIIIVNLSGETDNLSFYEKELLMNYLNILGENKKIFVIQKSEKVSGVEFYKNIRLIKYMKFFSLYLNKEECNYYFE